ncbi:hypothetical protein Q7P37_000497 [Cladosporium fusiforme]
MFTCLAVPFALRSKQNTHAAACNFSLAAPHHTAAHHSPPLFLFAAQTQHIATMAANRELLDRMNALTAERLLRIDLEEAAARVRQHQDAAAVFNRMYADSLLQYQRACDAAHRAHPQGVQCVSCVGRFHPRDVWQAPCFHHLCTNCLNVKYMFATADDMHYPPTCCGQELPWNEVEPRINPQYAASFLRKKWELDLPVGSRLYCSDADCSAFIGAKGNFVYAATCLVCGEHTCIACSAPIHYGDCPPNEELQQTVDDDQEAEWTTCGDCGRMIDIAGWNNHVTHVSEDETLSASKANICEIDATTVMLNGATAVAQTGRLAIAKRLERMTILNENTTSARRFRTVEDASIAAGIPGCSSCGEDLQQTQQMWSGSEKTWSVVGVVGNGMLLMGMRR